MQLGLVSDPEILSQLLPLGDSIIGAGVTIVTAAFTYIVGRKKAHQELQNLEAEKKSIEAASGMSTAEAAQVLTQAAAATVQPLLERIKEQRDEVQRLTVLVETLRTELAEMKAHNELMIRQFVLQGQTPPRLEEGKESK